MADDLASHGTASHDDLPPEDDSLLQEAPARLPPRRFGIAWLALAVVVGLLLG